MFNSTGKSSCFQRFLQDHSCLIFFTTCHLQRFTSLKLGIVTLLFGLTFLSVISGVNGGDGFWFSVFAGAVLIFESKDNSNATLLPQKNREKIILEHSNTSSFPSKGAK